jgi:undecaprenyl phosphate N,N'-diacetylbacillosamine 1-phosphate transferase
MYCRFLKAVFDRVLAFILIIVFLPIMIVVGIFVYVTIGSAIFFRQVRPGKNEKLFTIYKFRTMRDEKDSEGNLLPDEMRLKGVGKFIRSTSLDELPQLFNVLKGDMSFIGPRPLLVEYLKLYDDRQKRRHNVTPGITGWAQVNGRNAISWQKKFDLDIWYVDHCSFWLDLKILFMTFLKLFKRSDVSSSNHVTMERFKGNE